MTKPCLAIPLLLALLALAAEAVAAGLPWPIVFNDHDAVMFLAPGLTKPQKLGVGRSPGLSPDGALAVWLAGDSPSTARLMLHDLASGATSVLAKPGGTLRSPRFSPDGRTVVFVRLGDAATDELWLARPGEAPVRLARAGGQAGDSFFEPLWVTPDTIAYHDMHTLYRRNVNGNQPQATPLSALAPVQEQLFTSADRFAPDPHDNTILFSRSVPGTPLFRKKIPDYSSALFQFDPTTGQTRRLTPENLTAFAPVRAPDGVTILFTGYTDTQAAEHFPFRVWMLRPGGQPEFVCRGEDPMPPPAGR